MSNNVSEIKIGQEAISTMMNREFDLVKDEFKDGITELKKTQLDASNSFARFILEDLEAAVESFKDTARQSSNSLTQSLTTKLTEVKDNLLAAQSDTSLKVLELMDIGTSQSVQELTNAISQVSESMLRSLDQKGEQVKEELKKAHEEASNSLSQSFNTVISEAMEALTISTKTESSSTLHSIQEKIGQVEQSLLNHYRESTRKSENVQEKDTNSTNQTKSVGDQTDLFSEWMKTLSRTTKIMDAAISAFNFATPKIPSAAKLMEQHRRQMEAIEAMRARQNDNYLALVRRMVAQKEKLPKALNTVQEMIDSLNSKAEPLHARDEDYDREIEPQRLQLQHDSVKLQIRECDVVAREQRVTINGENLKAQKEEESVISSNLVQKMEEVSDAILNLRKRGLEATQEARNDLFSRMTVLHEEQMDITRIVARGISKLIGTQAPDKAAVYSSSLVERSPKRQRVIEDLESIFSEYSLQSEVEVAESVVAANQPTISPCEVVLQQMVTPISWTNQQVQDFRDQFTVAATHLNLNRMIEISDDVAIGNRRSGERGERTCLFRRLADDKQVKFLFISERQRDFSYTRANCPVHSLPNATGLCIRLQFTEGVGKETIYQDNNPRWNVEARD